MLRWQQGRFQLELISWNFFWHTIKKKRVIFSTWDNNPSHINYIKMVPQMLCLHHLFEMHYRYGTRRKLSAVCKELLKSFCWGFPGGAVVKNLPANTGDIGSSPGLGRSHMLRSNETRAPQLLSLCSRAHEPQLLSLCATTTEARTPRARAPQQEKPLQWEAHAPQRRESLRTATKAQRSQKWINKINLFKKKVSIVIHAEREYARH